MADFDELAVDGEDRARDAEINGEEHADGDERHFRGLEDAEPENEQRHPGDGGNGAQSLQRRIEQTPHGLAGTGKRAERDSRNGPGDESDENAPERHPGMGPQFAGFREAPERRDDAARRRHKAPFRKAERDDGLPEEGDGDGQ